MSQELFLVSSEKCWNSAPVVSIIYDDVFYLSSLCSARHRLSPFYKVIRFSAVDSTVDLLFHKGNIFFFHGRLLIHSRCSREKIFPWSISAEAGSYDCDLEFAFL